MQKKKAPAITPSLVSNWEASRSSYKKLEDTILDRIDYILNTWFSIFGAKLEYWYFEGAAEGEVGDLHRFMSSDSIWNFHTEVKNYPDNDMIFIDRDGDEYVWQSEIPTRWLYDDNFEEEIKKGKEEFEKREVERLAKKKQKSAEKKAKDDLLAQQAKQKLSKEELAALRRTL